MRGHFSPTTVASPQSRRAHSSHHQIKNYGESSPVRVACPKDIGGFPDKRELANPKGGAIL